MDIQQAYPYHGHLKNLALALTGKMDAHFTALRDHGYIKFWSPGEIDCVSVRPFFKKWS